MNNLLTSSTDFASLVNQLQESPTPALKQKVLGYLPAMNTLAKNYPLALFHLAQIYPPNSSHYKQTMRQSANLGCTNAMWVMCQLSLELNEPAGLKKAAHYMKLIQKSNDSFIKEQANSLLAEHLQLIKAMQEPLKSSANHPHEPQFFKTERKINEPTSYLEEKITPALNQ